MDPKKTGYKTSEFWVTVATTVLALANQSGVFHYTIPVDTIANVVHAAMAYVASRSVVKAAAAYAAGSTQAPKSSDFNS